MKPTNTQTTGYFLETLSSQEVEDIDLQILGDAEFAEELEMAETSLIEDYLENVLSAEETSRFETKYLNSDERLDRLEFLLTLKKIARTAPTKQENVEKPSGLFETLKNLFTPRKFALGFGLIVIIGVFGIVWRTISSTNGLNSELAAMNRMDLSNLDQIANSTNLILASGNLRFGGNASILDSTVLTERVFLRLVLPPTTPLDSTFRVSILLDKRVVSSLDRLRIYGTETTREFRLVLPAAILKKGEYEIELQNEASRDEKIVYVFVVR